MGRLIDMTGWIMKEHGIKDSRITVIKRNEEIYHPVEWWCKCKCGKIFSCRGSAIRSGKTKSCGCYHKEIIAVIGIRNQCNLVGKTFGYLTVLNDTGKRHNRQTIWHCICKCGNHKEVTEDCLKRGNTTSCGCRTKSRGEEIIKQILDEHNIVYKYNSGYFKDLLSSNYGILRYDYIIFKDNKPIRIIEFDGMQHYLPYDKFGGEKGLEDTKMRDQIKNQYALLHDIPLVRIPYNEINHITYEMLFNDTKYLIKEVN